jgi:hypothetical protein
MYCPVGMSAGPPLLPEMAIGCNVAAGATAVSEKIDAKLAAETARVKREFENIRTSSANERS